MEAGRILAPFAGIRFAADPVHGDGQGFVRLLADRTVGHGPGLEPPQNRLHRLHLLQGNRFGGKAEIEQSPQVGPVAAGIVGKGGELMKQPVVPLAGGLLHQVNGHGPELVELAFLPPHVLPAGGEPFGGVEACSEGMTVAAQHVFGDPFDADPFDARGGPGEVSVDHRSLQADRLEDLGAAVALDGGDPHLGHGLDHSLDGCLEVVAHGDPVIDTEQPLFDQLVEGFQGEIRVHRTGPVTDQQGELVDVAGLGGLQHQPGQGACPPADEVVMQP